MTPKTGVAQKDDEGRNCSDRQDEDSKTEEVNGSFSYECAERPNTRASWSYNGGCLGGNSC